MIMGIVHGREAQPEHIVEFHFRFKVHILEADLILVTVAVIQQIASQLFRSSENINESRFLVRIPVPFVGLADDGIVPHGDGIPDTEAHNAQKIPFRGCPQSAFDGLNDFGKLHKLYPLIVYPPAVSLPAHW